METIQIERNYWNSNTAMLLGIISQGQRFTNIEDIKCKYKKTKLKLKKIFGNKVPNFYTSNDMLWIVKIFTYSYKGRIYEEVNILPMAECNGRFNKFAIL